MGGCKGDLVRMLEPDAFHLNGNADLPAFNRFSHSLH